MVQDIIPFPSDLPPGSQPFARAVIAQLTKLKNAQQSINQNVSSTTRTTTQSSIVTSIPDATDTISGKSRFATADEATGYGMFPGSLNNTVAMTPASVESAIKGFVASNHGFGVFIDDWLLDPDRNGWYFSDGSAANRPPGSASNWYIGTHNVAGTFTQINMSGDYFGSVTDVYEVQSGVGLVNQWRRVNSGSWQSVMVQAATTTQAGIVELATNAETVTGTDTTRAVTPAGLKSAVAGLVYPIGTMMPYAGTSSPPAGFLWCQGQAVSRTTYSALFAVLGTTYGSGNGSTTFNLPKSSTVSNAGAPTPVPGTTLTGTFGNFDTQWGGSATFANFDAAWTTNNVTICYIIYTGI